MGPSQHVVVFLILIVATTIYMYLYGVRTYYQPANAAFVCLRQLT